MGKKKKNKGAQPKQNERNEQATAPGVEQLETNGKN